MSKVNPSSITHDAPAIIAASLTGRGDDKGHGPGLMPIATFVLWFGCLTVGLIGLRLRYPRAPLPVSQSEPTQAQLLNVDVTKSPLPLREPTVPQVPEATPPLPDQPPAPPEAPAAPPSPPLTAVAVPSPAIAFPVPVEGPTRVVDNKAAIPPVRTTPPATTVSPPPAATPVTVAPGTPHRLTFGEGEGDQPAPEYPREAVIAHQTGTVVVRFTVGPDRRVQKAEAATPCPWPLLNQAAVRAVRDSWSRPPARRLNPGLYDVSIEFQLKSR